MIHTHQADRGRERRRGEKVKEGGMDQDGYLDRSLAVFLCICKCICLSSVKIIPGNIKRLERSTVPKFLSLSGLVPHSRHSAVEGRSEALSLSLSPSPLFIIMSAVKEGRRAATRDYLAHSGSRARRRPIQPPLPLVQDEASACVMSCGSSSSFMRRCRCD